MTKIINAEVLLTAEDIQLYNDYLAVGRTGSESSIAISLYELARSIGDRSYIVEGNTKAKVVQGENGYFNLNIDTIDRLRIYKNYLEPLINNDFSIGSTSKTIKDLYISGLVNVGGDARGDIYYRDSNKFSRLPIGNIGDVLTVNDSGTISWEASSGGGDPVIYTAANVGLGTGIYKETVGTEYKFKTLTSSDSSLTISTPDENTINLVVPTPDLSAYLTKAGIESVTGLKTFDTSKLAMKGTSTGVTTFATANTSATNYTITYPAATGTVALTSSLLWTSVAGTYPYIHRNSVVAVGPAPSLSNSTIGNATMIVRHRVNNAYGLAVQDLNGVTFFHTTANTGYTNTVNVVGAFFYSNYIYTTDLKVYAGGNYVTLKSRNTGSSNITLYLPNSVGTSGYALTSNGAGDLVWADISGGTSTVFTATENGLVPAPGGTPDGSKYLNDLGNWETVSTGAVTTTLQVESGTSYSGTLKLMQGNAITITSNASKEFTINHADTSSASDTSNSGVNFIQNLTLDTYGHIQSISSATISTFAGSSVGLVPSVSVQEGKYLKDDGTWAIPQGTSHDAVTLSGAPTYITLSGQDIIRGLINLSTHVTGSLPITALAGYPNSTNQYLSGAGWAPFPTTPVDLSNYVTLTGAAQSITSYKTFTNVVNFNNSLEINNGAGVIFKGSVAGQTYITPAATTGSINYVLPAAQGTANQVLTNNGAGVLSWTTISPGGTTTRLKIEGGTFREGDIILYPESGIALTEGSNQTFIIAHAGTSTQDSSVNNGFTLIQSVELDRFGHVTSLGTSTLQAFTAITSGLVPNPISSTGRFLKDDGTWSVIPDGDGATTFLQLTDTPSTYVDSGLMGVRVKSDMSGLEFYTIEGGTSHSEISLSRQDLYLTWGAGGQTGQILTVAPINVGHINASGIADDKFLKGNGTWAVPNMGTGTVTDVNKGNGMNFTSFITSGTITLGTPSNITESSTNSLSANSHTHALILPINRVITTNSSGNVTGIVYNNDSAINVLASYSNTVAWIGFNFLGLSDTPSSYSTHAGKGVRVNSGATGLEFYTISSSSSLSNHSLTSSYHDDVLISNLTVGQVLKWNGTNWVNSNDLVGEPGDGDGYINSATFIDGILNLLGVGNAGAAVSLDGRYIKIDDNRGIGSAIMSGGVLTLNLINGATVTATIPDNNKFITDITGDGNSTTIFTFNDSTTIVRNFFHTHSEYITGNVIRSFNGRTTEAAALIKADVEAVLTGLITSHTHNYTNNTGTVTSVNEGEGISISGVNTVNPTIYIQSTLGTAGSVGQVITNGRYLGVVLGTTSVTAAAGNHTHTDLHTRSHSITDRDDHTATAWRLFYSNADGIEELALGTANQILVSTSSSTAPQFVNLSSLNTFDYGVRGLVEGADQLLEFIGAETRFLRADGVWIAPTNTGVGMSNPMTTTGDIIYASGGGTPNRLGIGATNEVLMVIDGIPSWEPLASTFVMSITGDIIAGTNQVSTLQPSAIHDKTPLNTGVLTSGDLFLFSDSTGTTLRNLTYTQLRRDIVKFTAKGQLLVGLDTSGGISTLGPNTITDNRVLVQNNSNTSWLPLISTNIGGMPTSIGTSNQYLRSNNTGYVLFTPGILTAGLGLSGSTYNTSTNITFSVIFGTSGTQDIAARADHTHNINAFTTTQPSVILGRYSLTAGSVQEITIGSNIDPNTNGISIAGGILVSKLENERLPKLSYSLNANNKTIINVNNITPNTGGIIDIGSPGNAFRHIYTSGNVYIGNNTTYYAGNSSGNSKFNDMTAEKVITRSELLFTDSNGNIKFKFKLSGESLMIRNANDDIVITIPQTGDASFTL
jgi:hypothetical protein